MNLMNFQKLNNRNTLENKAIELRTKQMNFYDLQNQKKNS